MAEEPEKFRDLVQATLRRHADAVNNHTAKGTYFFDYGNAFLLEASRARAEIMTDDGIAFRYPSYVQDIMGPMCFDYGFGPFRWVCTSGNPEDLSKTLKIFESRWRLVIVSDIGRMASPWASSEIWLEYGQ